LNINSKNVLIIFVRVGAQCVWLQRVIQIITRVPPIILIGILISVVGINWSKMFFKFMLAISFN